jgi:hypothetical protein
MQNPIVNVALNTLSKTQAEMYNAIENLLFDFKADELTTDEAILELVYIIKHYTKDETLK